MKIKTNHQIRQLDSHLSLRKEAIPSSRRQARRSISKIIHTLTAYTGISSQSTMRPGTAANGLAS